MLTIDPDEVLVFNQDLDPQIVEILIRDGLAMARRAAPCIDDEDFAHKDAAVAIIRSAVLRWAESGSGGITSESVTAGPFTQTTAFDNRQSRRSLFWPSEIKELEALCLASSRGRLGAIDTLPAVRGRCKGEHFDGCSFLFASTNSPCVECGDVLRPDWR